MRTIITENDYKIIKTIKKKNYTINFVEHNLPKKDINELYKLIAELYYNQAINYDRT